MLLWLDLETTGLDPNHDEILEVAWLPTDKDIKTAFDTRIDSTLIVPGNDTFDKIVSNSFVKAMHEHSGLSMDLNDAECGDSNAVRLEDAEDAILATIEKHSNGDPWFLAGASVHYDLRFLHVHMPRLAAKLEHRVYDTSSLKFLFESKGISLYEGYNNPVPHRAANDVEETLHLARNAATWVSAISTLANPTAKDTF